MKITDVAVAVFMQRDGSFLLASRPEGKPYAGYWEFPGGKIEVGEYVRDALIREIVEELNVVVEDCTPWFTFGMHYEHATVRLHTWRVTQWRDADAENVKGMHGMEGQQFAWQRLADITVAPTLAGCVPIFRALSLPTTYAITNASEIGVDAYLASLRALSVAIDHSSKSASRTAPNGEFREVTFPPLIQVREKNLPRDALEKFAREVIAISREHQSRVLINSDIALAEKVGAAGVHLTSAQLAALHERPDVAWVGASVHTRDALELAAIRKCDFAVLGSVKATASHPGQTPMGWDAFTQLVRDTPIPVYAIGGMTREDLAQAMRCGAHGIAMQRAALLGSK
jgi:8-oxo-dGTP diphosphatase